VPEKRHDNPFFLPFSGDHAPISLALDLCMLLQSHLRESSSFFLKNLIL